MGSGTERQKDRMRRNAGVPKQGRTVRAKAPKPPYDCGDHCSCLENGNDDGDYICCECDVTEDCADE